MSALTAITRTASVAAKLAPRAMGTYTINSQSFSMVDGPGACR